MLPLFAWVELLDLSSVPNESPQTRPFCNDVGK